MRNSPESAKTQKTVIVTPEKAKADRVRDVGSGLLLVTLDFLGVGGVSLLNYHRFCNNQPPYSQRGPVRAYLSEQQEIGGRVAALLPHKYRRWKENLDQEASKNV